MDFISINSFDETGFENTKAASSYSDNCICNYCATEGWAEAAPENPCTATRYRDSWGNAHHELGGSHVSM